ncbi:energy transducer TonB [Flavobacterium sp. UBA6135]|uniref:energy transducer TonB n=1 Tax=Flavobacterium sp. UBA6135 TaxID=1946553 RepID=UPI0025BAF349|nr:energy transducer TonB [Flavobacterium sp. UBA6135]
MEPKKNPNVDPRRNSFLYFSLGLMAMVVLSYVAIELKTYEKDLSGLTKKVDDSFLDEEVPMTQQLNVPPPPPPPPPPAPEIIKIVEDKKDIKETIIESTETNQREEVVKVETVKVIEEEPEVDVPFAIIEDVPIFPGCENVPKDKRRDCFNEKINQHIKKNFQYPEAAMDAGQQGRVFVNFVIEKDGSITIANLRGPYPVLEKEAARIINKIPKLTPGKQRGKAVRVPFSIPITFKLD